MTPDLILPLLMRWTHIGSAIVAVGGSVFLFFVMRPALSGALNAESRADFESRIMKRWKLLFHPLILLFLVSGFYNFFVVTAPVHKGQGEYHMLFGIKFLLALVMFGSGIIATSTKKWSEKMRDGNLIWWVLLASSAATVMVGGVMKLLPQAAAN